MSLSRAAALLFSMPSGESSSDIFAVGKPIVVSIGREARSKELYKSGGELVSPKEIEELLTAQEAVAQAYVVGVPDDRWGEIGCAWIVRTAGASLDEGQVIALAKDRLARFKVPKHVFFLDAAELPTTATGKVQKFQLVAMARRRLAEGPAPAGV